jgi:signal recognition particle subunit SRP54
MTPAERAKPEILNGSRRSRIANGSGTTVQDVNGLVNRFMETRKLMQQMGQAAAVCRACPAWDGRNARHGPPAKQQAKKGKNGPQACPATRRKRAGSDPAAAARPGAAPTEAEMQAAMADFQLPPELQKMLNQQNKGP